MMPDEDKMYNGIRAKLRAVLLADSNPLFPHQQVATWSEISTERAMKKCESLRRRRTRG